MLDTTIATPLGSEPVENTTTAALIERCLDGDQVAFNRLYRQFAPMIYRLNYSLLHNVEDAEEVLQDSFEYAFRRLHLFDASKSAFKTWLYRIAVSRCRNKRRRKWLPTSPLSHIMADDDDIKDDNAPSPDELLNLTEEQHRIWNALQSLSPKLREVAVLRYYEELRYNEIGDVLGIPGKTAESRMRLAHKKLKDILA